jgi:hypothetical protein
MMADIQKIQKLHAALVAELQKYPLEEAMNALAACSAAAIATLHGDARENLLRTYGFAIQKSIRSIDAGKSAAAEVTIQ